MKMSGEDTAQEKSPLTRNDVLQVAQEAADSVNDSTEYVTVEEHVIQPKASGEITKSRVVVAWVLIGIFTLICLDGAVMNIIDLVKSL